MADNQTSRRAKANFPTVLLTLLSIVQALALELMWTHLSSQTDLYSWSLVAVLGWLQLGANLLGILLVWLIYSDLVLRFSWVPTTIDAMFPFLVGILEFAQISTLGSEKIGLWFVVLALLFAAMAWISQVTMKRARQDDDNREFFANVSPATRRDYVMSILPVVLLLLVGVGLWLSQNRGWWAFTALLVATTLLANQIRMNHMFTQRSYHGK
ncbi:MAG: hypothetical protein ACI9ON_003501 [Limisphaerales bacterium]|jgi:hypothetical protein